MEFNVNYDVADSTSEWTSYFLVKSSAAFKSYCEKNNLNILLLPDKDYNITVKSYHKESKAQQTAKLKEEQKLLKAQEKLKRKEKRHDEAQQNKISKRKNSTVKFNDLVEVLNIQTNEVLSQPLSLSPSSSSKTKRKSKINSLTTHDSNALNPYVFRANLDLDLEIKDNFPVVLDNPVVSDTISNSRYPSRTRHPAKRG